LLKGGKKMKRYVRMFGITLGVLSGFAAAAPAGQPPLAGLAPYERPAGAPAIKEFGRSDAWRAAALRGVSQPVPDSVSRFLADQGAWYNPFMHSGMPGYYDLRSMHAPQKAGR
jgi:hypothetical protein